MKIVVGIDTNGLYRQALSLSTRLGFPDAEWILAYSRDIPSEVAYRPDLIDAISQAGDSALEASAEDAAACGIEAKTVRLSGDPASTLVSFAEEIGADLVAVHSERKGRFGSLFFGSVGRGLAIGAKHSVLISKGDAPSTGKLTAVFATDQSEYAARSLEKLIAMQPAGIGRIRLMTAVNLNAREVAHGLPVVTGLVEAAEERMQEDVRRFRAAGYEASGVVLDKHVNDAIRDQMEETQADLLLMGAQGHGFMHRLILGSTSLHQVVVEPYSVLIIRP
ncbi:MAG TPA: universal stress protein [Fimbriimonas sp.]